MDATILLKILEIITLIALGGLALWFRGNAKLSGMAAKLIAQAEDMYKDVSKAGGQKFEWVVDQLYHLIPASIRSFVPRSLIDALVQTTFDTLQGYAKLQLDKITNKITQ